MSVDSVAFQFMAGHFFQGPIEMFEEPCEVPEDAIVYSDGLGGEVPGSHVGHE